MALRRCFTDSAFNLALLRIVVSALILLSPETWGAPAWANVPPTIAVCA
ncbi:MAG: hypothetical protein RL701_2324 [Pseudomonadota bacterium]|jgi:hypothetical protein